MLHMRHTVARTTRAENCRADEQANLKRDLDQSVQDAVRVIQHHAGSDALNDAAAASGVITSMARMNPLAAFALYSELLISVTTLRGAPPPPHRFLLE